MLCSICKKNKAVKTRDKKADDGNTRACYCAACYRRLFLTDLQKNAPSNGEYSDKTERKIAAGESEKRGATLEKSVAVLKKSTSIGSRCRVCGTSADEYFKTGLLGCPECYRYLFFALKGSLRAMQGGEPHAGKRPTEGRETPCGEGNAIPLDVTRSLENRSILDKARKRGEP